MTENAAELLPKVEAFLAEQTDFLERQFIRRLEYKEIGGKGIPSDSLRGRVIKVQSLDDVEVGSAEYFGDGQFSAVFHADITCLATFDLSPQNLYHMPEDSRAKLEILDEEETYLIAEASMAKHSRLWPADSHRSALSSLPASTLAETDARGS